jgi:hypothetical protein
MGIVVLLGIVALVLLSGLRVARNTSGPSSSG